MGHSRPLFSCALLSALLVPVVLASIGVRVPEGDAKFALVAASGDREGQSPTTTHTVETLRSALAATTGKSAHAVAPPKAAPPPSEAVAAEAPAAPDAPPAAAASSDAGAPEQPGEAGPAASPPGQRPASLLADNQAVVFYGTPLARGLGILGQFEGADAADRVRRQAELFDQLNGDGRGAFGVMDLIYAVVQDQPTSNGLFLSYMPDQVVNAYIGHAEAHGVQVMLDLQIGRGDVLEEVKKIERFLVNPRVHVAIDPEYAVGSGGWPLATPGTIDGHQINAVQDYVASLVAAHHLPPKMVVVHQYLADTIRDGEAVRDVPDVDLVLNYDGFGAIGEKDKKYRYFSGQPHAQHPGYNIFLQLDERVLSEQELMQLEPLPDVVFYQ
ncbi:MAG TPA: hypothetical protein VNM91_08830 [Dehalococcoidia bacterium]|nr:hypothetical protein [Dehalococcoidia bacterium]